MARFGWAALCVTLALTIKGFLHLRLIKKEFTCASF
jgi:hypothetical protein